MPGRNGQVARIYTVLTLLDANPQGLTIADILMKVTDRGHAIEKRTVYRDIAALQEAGFPLIEEKGAGSSGADIWRLERTTRVADYFALNSRELLALYLARGALTPLRDTPFFTDLQSIFSKMESRLGSQNREHLDEISSEIHFEPGPRWGLGVNPDVLETVRACCTEKNVLSITYSSVSSNTHRVRRLGPHFIYFAKGALYLVAEDLEDREVKLFAIPRMRDAQMLNEEPYDAPTLDPEKFFESTFGVFKGGSPENIKIEFSRIVAPYVRERGWHSSQSIVNKADGSIHFSMQVGITPELVQWVLGFGTEAHVIEPGSLAKKIRDAAAGVVEMYSVRAA